MVESPSVCTKAGGVFVSSVHVVKFEIQVRVIRTSPWRPSVKHPATDPNDERGALYSGGCLRCFSRRLGEADCFIKNDTPLG